MRQVFRVSRIELVEFSPQVVEINSNCRITARRVVVFAKYVYGYIDFSWAFTFQGSIGKIL